MNSLVLVRSLYPLSVESAPPQRATYQITSCNGTLNLSLVSHIVQPGTAPGTIIILCNRCAPPWISRGDFFGFVSSLAGENRIKDHAWASNPHFVTSLTNT